MGGKRGRDCASRANYWGATTPKDKDAVWGEHSDRIALARLEMERLIVHIDLTAVFRNAPEKYGGFVHGLPGANR